MFELFKIGGTIGVNNSEANEALEETDSKAESTSKSIGKKMQDGLGKAEKAIGGVGKNMTKWVTGPVVGAATGLFGLANTTANYADELFDLSAQTGISTDGLQEMNYWASQNGVSQSSLERATGRLNQRIGLAADGNDKYAEAFKGLGVEIEETDGSMRGTQEVMSDTIVALSEIEDGSAQSAAASEIFGTKLSRELMPSLQDGAMSMEEAAEVAHELGMVMDEEAVIAADNFAQEIDDLKFQFGGLFREIGMSVIPILSEVLFPLIQEHIIPAIASFSEKIGELLEWFSNLDPSLQGNIAKFIALAAAIGPVLIVVAKVIGAIKLLIPVFGALFSPIGLVISAVTALVGVMIWLYNTNGEVREAIDRVWNAIQEVVERVTGAVVGFVKSLWGDLKAWWDENQEAILETARIVWDQIEEVVSEVMAFLLPLIETTWTQIQIIIETVMGIIQSIIEITMGLIRGDWEQVWTGIKNFVGTIVDGIFATIDNIFGDIFRSISEWISDAYNSVKETFTNIRDTISETIENARDTVRNAIEAIKGFFDFEWSLPKLKLPRISMTGSFSLSPPSVPSFGIDWFAQGGILEKATAFGMNGNNVQVGGEAGREAVLPLNASNLAGIGAGIAKASGFDVEGIKDMLRSILGELQSVGGRPIVIDVTLDGKVLARVTRDPMDRELGKKERDKNQAKGRR